MTENPTMIEGMRKAGVQANGPLEGRADPTLAVAFTADQDRDCENTLSFASAACTLGTVLIAWSERGLCALLLGDDPALLLNDLRRRFPKAHLIADPVGCGDLIAKVLRHIEEPGNAADVPLDLRGTAFQQRVWQALREIPAGSTTSYTELARKIGMPRAVRAVAQACAANPLAIAIPCHRVLRADGALSGYRWGLERKRELLQREVSASSSSAAKQLLLIS